LHRETQILRPQNGHNNGAKAPRDWKEHEIRPSVSTQPQSVFAFEAQCEDGRHKFGNTNADPVLIVQ
jgi:hypothetical protein